MTVPLTELMERVMAAPERDTRVLMIQAFNALVPEGDDLRLSYRFFTLLDCGGYIDAALILVERVLPGWGINLYTGWATGQPSICRLTMPTTVRPADEEAQYLWSAKCPTLPLAILACLLRAQTARGPG